MKAFVIFSSLLIACSSHVINKRSLLGGRQAHSQGHQGHHDHHQQHHGQRHATHQPRNKFGLRTGRDGDHHHDESAAEIRAAPDGYLPAAADYDYEEDLAGQASERDQAQYGVEKDQDGDSAQVRDGQDQQGQYGDYQDQYVGAEPKAAEYDDNAEEGYSAPAEAASDVSRSADEDYGAPAGRTAPDGYGAPEEGSGDAEDQDPSRIADDEYSAPAASDNVGSDYAAPIADSARAVEEEYGAPGQYAGSSNGFPFEIVDGQSSSVTAAGSAAPGSEEPKLCPGGDIAACIMVCPGISTRVYGACVQGCVDRCPEI